jgi:hypothetical protein
MAQKVEAKNERPLQSFSLKNWLAVNTTNSRIALQPQQFGNLENVQPIGASNLHSIQDISASLANFASDNPYYDFSCNINNTEYLIIATASGKLYAYAIATQTLTQINGSATLSGSVTRMAQFSNTQLLVIDSAGYYSWGGSGNIVAITGSGAPTSGTAIAVYQNVVWIAVGRTLYFSASASYTDFTTTDGGGTYTMVDPTLRSNITALLSADGYLYIFGITSVNAISDLYVPQGASPPTPTFTNLNLSAIVGTDQPYSIFMYGRLVFFANRYGAWSIYGTTVNAISAPDPNNAYASDIDGTWQYLNFSQAISGGQVVSNSLLCGAFLVQRLNDPVFGSNTVIAMYQGDAAGGKWWFANWGALTRITTAYVNNVPALFGYIGNQLYQLFAVSTSSPPATIQTALWDFGDPITEKQVIKAGFALTTYIPGGGVASFTLDTPVSSTPVPFTNLGGQVIWENSLGQIVTWKNASSQTVTWVPVQYSVYWGQAPQGYAKVVGYTFKTNQGMVFEFDAFLMDYKWGPRWVGN